MTEERIRACNRCIYLRNEHRVSDEFIDPQDLCRVSIDGSSLPDSVCQHAACFRLVEGRTPERGATKRRERIAGQAQLNRDNDCKFYRKRRWWQAKP